MRDDIDESSLQANADLSATLTQTDDATPGTSSGARGQGAENQIVDTRGAPVASTGASDHDQPQASLEGAERMADPADQVRQTNQTKRREEDAKSKRPTYLTLIGIFFTVLAFFARREQRSGERGRVGGYDLALLSLGSYRMARLVAFDQVTEPLRAPVTKSKPGGQAEPKGGAIRGAVGEMVSCPTCIGTWIAASLTYAFRLFPAPTRLFLALLSASAIAETLHYAVNTIDALGKAATKRAER